MGTFTIYAIWARWHDTSYEQDTDIVAAFETKAQAYARMQRLQKMVGAYERRVQRWHDSGLEGPEPQAQGPVKGIVKRFGQRAVLYVAPLKVTRGVK